MKFTWCNAEFNLIKNNCEQYYLFLIYYKYLYLDPMS